jgi:hypothetical protein
MTSKTSKTTRRSMLGYVLGAGAVAAIPASGLGSTEPEDLPPAELPGLRYARIPVPERQGEPEDLPPAELPRLREAKPPYNSSHADDAYDKWVEHTVDEMLNFNGPLRALADTHEFSRVEVVPPHTLAFNTPWKWLTKGQMEQPEPDLDRLRVAIVSGYGGFMLNDVLKSLSNRIDGVPDGLSIVDELTQPTSFKLQWCRVLSPNYYVDVEGSVFCNRSLAHLLVSTTVNIWREWGALMEDLEDHHHCQATRIQSSVHRKAYMMNLVMWSTGLAGRVQENPQV